MTDDLMIIKRSTLVGIADAVRSRTNETEEFPVTQIESKIRNLSNINTEVWNLTKSDGYIESKNIPKLKTDIWEFTLETNSKVTKDIEISESMDLSDVTDLSIPEGVVACIYNDAGNLIWEREALPKPITITTTGYPTGNSGGPGTQQDGCDVSYNAYVMINGQKYGSGDASITVTDGTVITLVTEGVGKGAEYAKGGIYINGTRVAIEYGANSENATATYTYTVRRPLKIELSESYWYYSSGERYVYYGTIRVTTL